MDTVDQISERYITAMAALDPLSATSWGVPGHEDKLTDFSPAGLAARADLQRRTLAELDEVDQGDDLDRVAVEVMAERLGSALDQYETGELARPLRVLFSPLAQVRSTFDLMRFETAADWEVGRTRMAAVPAALAGIQELLQDGLDRDHVVARRQALACALQCDAWGHGDDGFWVTLGRRSPSESLAAEAAAAADAYRRLGQWLRESYAPRATPHDPVGRDRYQAWARAMNGTDLDLDETYAWGWAELRRVEDRMLEVAGRILPGATLEEVIAHVEADPSYAIDGVEEFQRWNQDLIDSTIAAMDGVHFEIAEPLRRCEAMIAPPGGAAAMYYTGPSEDFSRPGRTWYPTLGKTRFPLWREVSICYHEGVPGHHLQIAQVRYLADTLTRFQRLASGTSGHAEGWALYAERLMQELGFLDDPVFELGQLTCQAMRSVRVIVDIGMHLELPIPDDEPYHPGETWTPELALPFVIERSRFPSDFMASEVDRYLGMPGQAISYKVGERVWLDSREAARQRLGAAFDLKEFHRAALDLGGMGLDQLASELGRL
ncbi:MAG TPA: DUF885 domain-containing protein [Acidimicrobiales bacterium]|nr:DUF885 domain-containing protein [Acidimicrobiales bacterium]